ncbi:MAG: dehydrogenase [Ignavibacteriales bacterium]
MEKRKKIVIVGGGFGGLTAAKELRNSEFDVTIIDRTNHHLFQPLLYQVATAALSPGDIAVPIRAVFNDAENITVLMDEVKKVDKNAKKLQLNSTELDFDYLILAPGARHSYFGNPEWEGVAPGLKTVEDALQIREKILLAFERAELTNDLAERKALMTFVIIGGGPTGVEMAGAIAEMARKDLKADFRRINTAEAKIYLVEAAPGILTSYPDDLSYRAKEDLTEMGVTVLTGKKVTAISENRIMLDKEDMAAGTVIWAAGNQASSLLKTLDVPLDRAGRVIVEKDLSIPGNQEIFVIGDSAFYEDAKEGILPGIATVAIQQARHVVSVIKNNASDTEFRYLNKGSMATIGRAKAIAVVGKLKFSGVVAWMLWSFIHILYLIGFKNRFKVMAEWVWYYLSFRHSVRLITRKG